MVQIPRPDHFLNFCLYSFFNLSSVKGVTGLLFRFATRPDVKSAPGTRPPRSPTGFLDRWYLTPCGWLRLDRVSLLVARGDLVLELLSPEHFDQS